jgi:hypothetical protein
MTGAEIIRKNRNHYIVLVNDGKDILLHPNGIRPLILDSLPEAKNLACQFEGRWVELSEFLKEKGN